MESTVDDSPSTPVQAKRSLPVLAFLALFRPGVGFQEIGRRPRSWAFPLIVVALLALFAVVASGPARVEATRAAFEEAQAEFGAALPDEGFEGETAQATPPFASPLFIYVFPGVGSVVFVVLGWLVVGSILHLMLTLVGTRSQFVSTLNIAAWALLPLGIRSLVQGVYTLATGSMIASEGLSGFAPTEAGFVGAALAVLLSMVDIYAIWHVLLLAVGLRHKEGDVSPSAARLAVIITVALIVIARVLVGGGLAQAAQGLVGGV